MKEPLSGGLREVEDYLKTYSLAGMDISCVVDENLPQLLDSKGGSHVTNVPVFDKEDFTSWKVRFLVFLDGLEPYLLKTLEDGPFIPMSSLSTFKNSLPKRQNQWSNAESHLANHDKRLKSSIISYLPNDVMKSISVLGFKYWNAQSLSPKSLVCFVQFVNTYSFAYTKLILRVKKLEAQIKVGKARRHTRVVLSDTEVGQDDSSKQGRKFSNKGVQDDEGVHEKASNETEIFVQEVTPTEVIQDQEGSKKVSDEVSTAGLKKGHVSEEVPTVSTAGGTVTYSRRSAEKRSRKDKGKAILIEEEPKKKSKKDIEQEQLSYAEAIRLEEQMNEEQRAQIARDAEIARQ
ncbi:hypothetical protein Tco_1267609 [Tanacetum coccineum]